MDEPDDGGRHEDGQGHGPPLAVTVWGEYACFTRPENKVERVSYPVMTPSAARGVLEAILWKPEFAWRIAEIAVLAPIRYASILRNEVSSRASARTAQGWARNGGGFFAEEDRTQRHTLALRDVAYAIRAWPIPRSGNPNDAAKYRDQFRRRVAAGRCFATPYLGCREFSASFGERDPRGRAPIPLTTDLGRMLLDIAYDPDGQGRGAPVFFDAALAGGVLRPPAMPPATVSTGGRA
jgi:CRISPR-associated protein Cas5d